MNRAHFEVAVLVLAAVSLIVPLVVVGGVSIPTLTSKVFVFQLIVLFLGAAYTLLLFLDWRRYRPKFTPLTCAILLWGVSLAISTLLGVDWHRSLWSTSVRMTGVVLVSHFILFYLIVSAVIREWKDWQLLFRLFLGVGIVVVFFGLVLEAGASRMASTTGNPTFFGGFTLFLVFLGVLLAVKEKKNHWLLFALFGVVTALIGLFASSTRGALVGLFCGAGFVLFWYIVSAARSKKGKMAVLGAACVLFSVLFVILLFGVFQRDDHTATANTRLLAWEAGFYAWQDRPIFGWGPGNFAYGFNAHYPPEILQYGIAETWFDNAHSVPFTTLATQGFVGLAAYLGIFGAVGFMLWRRWKEKIFDIHLVAVGGGLLVAYFVQNLFLFDTPTSYHFFFLFLAFLNGQYIGTSKNDDSLRSAKRNILLQGIAVSLALLGLFILSIMYQLSDELLVSARGKLKENPQEALILYEKAKHIPSPYFRSASTSFLVGIVRSLPQIHEKDEMAARELFSFAQEEIETLRKLHPLEVWLNGLHIRLLQKATTVFPEEDFRKDIKEILQDGLAKSPGRQEFQYELALLNFELNKPKEAILQLEGMRSLNPGIQRGWDLLICTYSPSEEAKKTMENVLQDERFGEEEKAVVQKIINPC